jgi:hypothetical protein
MHTYCYPGKDQASKFKKYNFYWMRILLYWGLNSGLTYLLGRCSTSHFGERVMLLIWASLDLDLPVHASILAGMTGHHIQVFLLRWGCMKFLPSLAWNHDPHFHTTVKLKISKPSYS